VGGVPTYEQLDKAVFDMVVAGRVVGEGDDADVAIMMVEAEASDKVYDLIATVLRRRPRRSWPRVSRPRSRSSRCCARPRPPGRGRGQGDP